jgi:hypothetical protein
MREEFVELQIPDSEIPYDTFKFQKAFTSFCGAVVSRKDMYPILLHASRNRFSKNNLMRVDSAANYSVSAEPSVCWMLPACNIYACKSST